MASHKHKPLKEIPRKYTNFVGAAKFLNIPTAALRRYWRSWGIPYEDSREQVLFPLGPLATWAEANLTKLREFSGGDETKNL